LYYPNIDKISGVGYEQLGAKQKSQTHHVSGFYFDNDGADGRDLPVATAKRIGCKGSAKFSKSIAKSFWHS
jgi:hypothetical protein